MINANYLIYLKNIALGPYAKKYNKLCTTLYLIPFESTIPMDDNRIEDALDMRRSFDENGLYPSEVSVFEVLVALAQSCYYSIFDDGDGNDKTYEIFMLMLNNLGLMECIDRNYNESYVVNVVDRFLDRKYDPDGKGSPFYIPHIDKDMREVDLWYQAMWYIDTIIN